MSVVGKYAGVVKQYGTPESLASQDPRLLNQIITELGQSGEAQDQAAYEQLKTYYNPNVGGGGFVIHQDMKDAMTRQQQAYAAPAPVAPSSNPIYNQANAGVEGNIKQSNVEAVKTVSPLLALTTIAANTSDRAILNEAAKQFYPSDKVVSKIEFNPNSKVFTTYYEAKPVPAPQVQAAPSQDLGQQAKGFASDFFSGIGKVLTGQRQSLPSLGLPVGDTLTAGERGAVKNVGLATVAILAIPAGPAVGVSYVGVAGGEALGVGVNQAVKAFRGGGLLTPEEALQSAAEGGAFSLAGAGVLKGIGAAGKALNIGLPKTNAGVLSASGKVLAGAGRVGVNTALGGGAGYVLSGGDVEAAKEGALFGAAFGLAGEAAGVVAPRVQARMRDSIPGQKAQSYINKYYDVDVATGKRGTEIGLGERVMQKALGVKPEKPGLQVLEQSTIPTAPKEAFETVKITELKGGELVTNKRLIEKGTPESTRLIPKMQGNLQVSDDLTMMVKGKEVVSPNTVLKGSSVEPNDFYAQGKPKTAVIGEPKLGFNKQTGPVTEFEVYSFRESSKAGVKPITGSELSFSRRTMNFKEIQANIKSGRIKGVNVASDLDIAVANKNMPIEKSYGDYPWKGTDARSLLEKGSLVQAGKGKTLLIQEKPFVDGLTSGKAAQATGIGKVLGDIQTGRSVDTARVSVGKRTVNPFTSYAGRSYYGGRGGQAEEVETQYLTMPGQVARLDKTGVSASGASGFMPSLTGGVAGFDVKPEPASNLDRPMTVPIFVPGVTPFVTPDSKPDMTPIEVPVVDEIVVPVQEQPLIPDQWQQPTPDQGQPVPQDTRQDIWIPTPSKQKGTFSFPNAGFKFEGGGSSLGSALRGIKVGSRKKVYPILSGVDVLGLGGKKKHAKKVGKAKKR
jgi:hypothetical protein